MHSAFPDLFRFCRPMMDRPCNVHIYEHGIRATVVFILSDGMLEANRQAAAMFHCE